MIATKARFHYLDHMRGLMIAFVVLQHAVQGYAEQWGGRMWFIDLPDRSRAFDVMFMWTDAFIMQALFFLAGMFVLPSLYRRGWLSFIKEKTVRLFIPMLVGIAVLVPPLRYVKYEETQEPGIGYFDYWWNVFLTPENFSPAGFWFIAFLLLFTFVTAFVDLILPILTRFIGRLTAWLAGRPVVGYLIVAIIASILIGYSDVRWGTPWWMGLGDLVIMDDNSWLSAFVGLFVARSNMLFSYIFFFILGVGVANADLLKKTDIMERASANWLAWVGLLVILSVAYSWYNQAHLYTGAFSNDIQRYFAMGGSMDNAWGLIREVAPGLLIRTTLHGFMCTAQIFTIMIVLYKFTNDDIGKWASLGACSYGIFYLHEPIVVWSQYGLMNVGLPNGIKMAVVFAFALGLAWTLTAKVLHKTPLVKHVF